MVHHNPILLCNNILSVHDRRYHDERLRPWNIHDSLPDSDMGFQRIRNKQEKHSGKLRPALRTAFEKMHGDHFAGVDKLQVFRYLHKPIRPGESCYSTRKRHRHGLSQQLI